MLLISLHFCALPHADGLNVTSHLTEKGGPALLRLFLGAETRAFEQRRSDGFSASNCDALQRRRGERLWMDDRGAVSLCYVVDLGPEPRPVPAQTR